VLSLLQSPRADRTLHSFPTRRSSDLDSARAGQSVLYGRPAFTAWLIPPRRAAGMISSDKCFEANRSARPPAAKRSTPSTSPRPRSEEHTSELQSRVDLVCRLLLEKKK